MPGPVTATGWQLGYHRCEQVDDLLSLVVELKEEVERLTSIRDCGKGIDWWSRTLPSLQEGCGGDALQAAGAHLPSHCQVGGGDLKDSKGWKQVPVWGNKRTAPHPVPPSQVPYITGMRLWSWSDWGMWMLVEVHPCRRGCPRLVSLLPVLLHRQSGKKEGLSS